MDRGGYNESEGCYVLRAGGHGVAFAIHGKQTPRMRPVLKVKGWPCESVQTATLGGRKCEPAKEYIASVKDEVALVLLCSDIRGDMPVSLSGK